MTNNYRQSAVSAIGKFECGVADFCVFCAVLQIFCSLTSPLYKAIILSGMNDIGSYILGSYVLVHVLTEKIISNAVPRNVLGSCR